MKPARTFAIDGARIVHETVEDETIIIDLTTGTYYSLTGSGTQVWAWLVDGHSEQDVLAALDGVDAARSEVVADFICQLCDEGLLEETSPSGARLASLDTLVPAGPLEPPRLERYTDMEQLLLLDPIHQVQAAGWPNTAETADTATGSGAAE